MRLRRNDKGEYEEANDIHVTPELLILSKLEPIEEKLQLISSKLDLEEKADYENRLKADMVAMLEELKKEIIELPFPQREPEYMQGYSYCQMNILDYVIQDKINKLKEK